MNVPLGINSKSGQSSQSRMIAGDEDAGGAGTAPCTGSALMGMAENTTVKLAANRRRVFMV